jgi:hypothetical protein
VYKGVKHIAEDPIALSNKDPDKSKFSLGIGSFDNQWDIVFEVDFIVVVSLRVFFCNFRIFRGSLK